jgi:DNA-binding transcriptional ArsR family regulator
LLWSAMPPAAAKREAAMSEVDRQITHALRHPLRVEILRRLERGPNSPNGLSKEIGEKLGNCSYHMKELLKLDCVELVETVPRRGAVEHFYGLKPHRVIGFGDWNALPPTLRTTWAGSALAEFTKRAVEALDAGTVESREESGVDSFPLSVDEQGWTELRRVLGDVEKRFRAVADKSAERMKSPRDRFPVIVAVAAFEVPTGEDVDPS